MPAGRTRALAASRARSGTAGSGVRPGGGSAPSPLLPQRRPLARPAPRDQERAGRVLAEARSAPTARARRGGDPRSRPARAGGRRAVAPCRNRCAARCLRRPQRLHVEIERLAQARARGRCTRPPNGERMQTRRRRSGRESARRRASGRRGRHRSRVPATRRNARKFLAASASSHGHRPRLDGSRDRRCRRRSREPLRSRRARPAGRLPRLSRTARRRHAGSRETSTRSRVTRQVERAEDEGLALARLVHHLLVELPTRPPPSERKTPKRHRSGIVPAFVTAGARCPCGRERCLRSVHNRRRSSANSSEG